MNRTKGDKSRVVPLVAAPRAAPSAIRPVTANRPIFCGERGPYTDRGSRNRLAALRRRECAARSLTPIPPRRGAASCRGNGSANRGRLLGHSRLDTIRIYTQPNGPVLERGRPRAQKHARFDEVSSVVRM